jgi:NTP pyrophosphatase (non-canonical NTP hydrolase)
MSDNLTLVQFYEDVCNFHDYFDTPKSLQAASRKLAEETTEAVISAIAFDEGINNDYEGDDYRQALLLELGDVLYCVCGLARAAGLNANELAGAAQRIVAKNRNKTLLTHEVKSGMVVRRT